LDVFENNFNKRLVNLGKNKAECKKIANFYIGFRKKYD
jgi:hypothetical protein